MNTTDTYHKFDSKPPANAAEQAECIHCSKYVFRSWFSTRFFLANLQLTTSNSYYPAAIKHEIPIFAPLIKPKSIKF